MQTGPRAQSGFDLALTEILDGGRHEFLVEKFFVEGDRISLVVSDEGIEQLLRRLGDLTHGRVESLCVPLRRRAVAKSRTSSLCPES